MQFEVAVSLKMKSAMDLAAANDLLGKIKAGWSLSQVLIDAWIVGVRQIADPRQVRDHPIHAENPVGHNQPELRLADLDDRIRVR